MKTVFAIVFAAAAATAATVRVEDGGKTFLTDVPPPGQTNFNERAGFYVTDAGEVVWTRPYAPTGTGRFATVSFTDGKTAEIELPVEGKLNHAAHHRRGGIVERVYVDHAGTIVSNYVGKAEHRPKRLRTLQKDDGKHVVRIIEEPEPATNGWTRIDADPPDKWHPPRGRMARRRQRRKNAIDRVKGKQQ